MAEQPIQVQVRQADEPADVAAFASCWLQGKHVHAIEAFPSPTGDVVTNYVLRWVQARREGISRYGLADAPVGGVILDAIGVGASPVDQLTGYEEQVPLDTFAGNAKPTDRLYANARAESYVGLGKAIADSKLAVPRDAELWEELLAHTWFLNPQGRFQIIAKDDVRHILGRSPNKSDALALAHYQGGCAWEGDAGAVVGF